jgi:hypothetical protein
MSAQDIQVLDIKGKPCHQQAIADVVSNYFLVE